MSSAKIETEGNAKDEKVTISSITIGSEINDWLYEKQRELGLTSRQGVIRHVLAQKKSEEEERSKTNELLEEIIVELKTSREENEEDEVEVKKDQE